MKNTFLPFTLTDCITSTDRIDIWQYPLDMDFPQATSLLSPEEKLRANRYYFPHHQIRFTQARAMLRLILARYANINPREISWAMNPYGTPELCPRVELQFNLSHSNNMAMLAIGQHYPLGVDVEFFAERPFTGIAGIMFSPKEQKSLLNTHNSCTQLAFYNVWAQKEAFIKACGLGLSYPTQSFDVQVLPGTTYMVVDKQKNIDWRMTSFVPQLGCCAAVCYHPSVNTIRYLAINKPLNLE